MKYCDVGGVTASRIVIGCMRMADKPLRQVEQIIFEALKSGANTFDHADIYGKGDSETLFGVAVRDLGLKREDLILQSKCGIRPGFYDFSYEHILASVEGSLKRLNCEYLDVLLLHRPDALMDEYEVCKAFDRLQADGKVRAFGVSNFSPLQIELLRSAGVQVAINQVQFSLMQSALVDEGLNVNTEKNEAAVRTSGLMDYCRLNKVKLQAWSPLSYGFMDGIFVGDEKFPALNAELFRIAEKYEVAPAAIAVAWILRHPAAMQAVVGSTTPERVADICKAADIKLTREEWYSLYTATGKTLP